MQTATLRNFARPGPCRLRRRRGRVSETPLLLAKVAKQRRGRTGSRSTSGRRTGCCSLLPFSPCAVEFLVENPRPRPLAAQGGHDEAGAAKTPLRFRDCPPRAAPRPPGPVTEVAEPSLAGRNAAAARPAQLPALRQTGVAGQAEQVVDIVVVAPRPVAARRRREPWFLANACESVRRCAPVPPPPHRQRSRAATASAAHGCRKRRTAASNTNTTIE